jgi:hypothetical protein
MSKPRAMPGDYMMPERHIENTEGTKYDSNKLRVDLLSIPSLLATSQILTIGSKKYGSRNWEKGMKWSRVYGALLRHLFAWFIRIPFDAESKQSHLSHASCCLMFLQHYEITKTGEDDRPINDGDMESLFDDRSF